jgi:hypothetical protein
MYLLLRYGAYLMYYKKTFLLMHCTSVMWLQKWIFMCNSKGNVHPYVHNYSTKRWGGEVELLAFLTLPPDGCKWWVKRAGHLAPKGPVPTGQKAVGPRAGADDRKKIKIPCLVWRKSRFLGPYTDWSISAPDFIQCVLQSGGHFVLFDRPL